METERRGLETEMHWERMEVESWGCVERDLRPGKKLGRMGRGWDDMGEKWWGRWDLGKQGSREKIGFQETRGFQEKMGRWRRLPSCYAPGRYCSGALLGRRVC